MEWTVSIFFLSSSRSQLKWLPGRDAKVILAKNGEIFVVLAGQPPDPTYFGDLEEVDSEMGSACDQVPAPSGENTPRRGCYAQLTTGISYGGGAKASTKSR